MPADGEEPVLRTDGERLQKVLAAAGVASRRASEILIDAGRVSVNGRVVREQGLENKFRGKNFVFDGRRGERIGDEIISQCHQCEAPSDNHQNCANDDCHLLFLQCAGCAAQFEGCCCEGCREWKNLSAAQKAGRVFQRPAGFNDSQNRRRARRFDVG